MSKRAQHACLGSVCHLAMRKYSAGANGSLLCCTTCVSSLLNVVCSIFLSWLNNNNNSHNKQDKAALEERAVKHKRLVLAALAAHVCAVLGAL